MRRIHAGRIIALVALVALSAMAVQTLYKPYREKLTHGIVDWDQGWIRADASVPLKTGVPAAQARVQARRVAVMKAQAEALRIAMRLPVDSESRLESYEALRIHVRGIVAGGEVVSEGVQNGAYALSLRVPINGVKGIAAEVAKVTLPPPEREAAPPHNVEVPSKQGTTREEHASSAPGTGKEPVQEPGVTSLAAFSSVTVDASQTGVKPALHARIIDPDGREIYGVKTVKPLVTRERTLARYVTKGDSSGSPDNVSWLNPGRLGAIPLALISPPQFLLAQRTPSRRPRGSEESLTVRAENAAGKLKADIVVTRETAEKLRKLNEKTGALTEGRVVVIVRADVGGVESRKDFRCPSRSSFLARR
jgi:hypothetical protein